MVVTPLYGNICGAVVKYTPSDKDNASCVNDAINSRSCGNGIGRTGEGVEGGVGIAQGTESRLHASCSVVQFARQDGVVHRFLHTVHNPVHSATHSEHCEQGLSGQVRVSTITD